MSVESERPRRARGEIERLPSGSLRVRVYVGVDPVSKKRNYLVQIVPPGPGAAQQAEDVRARLLQEAAELSDARRRARAEAKVGPPTPRGTGADRTRGRAGGGLTVAAIAQLAGVSPPTVSKVLNGRRGVAAQTERRVKELLREQGYRRPEKVTRAAVVEVVFYGGLSDLTVEIMAGVKQVAVKHGLAVGFTDALREASTGRSWVQDLLARRPTGVIAVHATLIEEHGMWTAAAIPVVAVDPGSEPLHPIPSVGAANRRGGFAAAQHLLNLGHRRIAVITGPLQRTCARDRLEGVRAALAAAQVPLDESLVRTGIWFSFEDGLNHARELLRLPDPPTAVLCGNDLQGLGVYEAARQVGIRIPDDLSVVGFDDIPHTRWCGPSMTTVRQPFTDMGATAAELVVALAEGETVTQTHVELATALIPRDSTAPPPAG